MKNITLALLVFCGAASGVRAEHGYTVHEWGTFTSVQGGDGKLLEWRPLQSAELPRFVHVNLASLLTKGEMVTLQRLETPVIYFHSAHPLKVDVEVSFPKGMITEWYPYAAMLDAGSWSWKDLSVLADSSQGSDGLPQDNSGSHYFAAREATSQRLQAAAPKADEFEKFLFYRGAGSFGTPLRVSVGAEDAVRVENTGAQKLSHMFLVRIENGRGAFSEMKTLPSHTARPKNFSGLSQTGLPLAKFQEKIAARIVSALTAEGLYADEARAMVDTWKDSWFTEEGERVLYILPRDWTDEILPLKISPAPEKLVRVMVGRAEILAPTRISRLRQALRQAAHGDTAAHALADAQLKSMGRFAMPAKQLANPPGTPVAASTGL